MRLDLNRLESEIAPLLEVHGVELVALEWHKGPGHGILRVFIDHPGGDPRVKDPDKSVSLTIVTDVTRDVSAALDALDLIEGAYTLELGSPGPERPVQKREDFDRFTGYDARVETREPHSGRSAFSGVLRGTVDHPDGGFAVRVELAGKVFEIPAARLSRARLHEFKDPPKTKPGKGPSKRQERLKARDEARAINAAHLAARAATATTPSDASGESAPTNPPNDDTTKNDTPAEAVSPREAKR